MFALVWQIAVLSAEVKNGMQAEYFDESNLTQMRQKRIDPKIDFDWGQSSPDSSMGPDEFSVRWSGQIEAPWTATYSFRVVSDDGVRLRINDTIIINRWNKGTTNKTGRLELAAGKKYPVILEYQEGTGDARIRLYWSTSSAKEEIVPAKYFFQTESKPSLQSVPGEIAVVIDAQKENGRFDHFWEKCVGSCNARLYLAQDLIRHLKDAHDHLGFEYVRFHNLLTDDVGIYKRKPGEYPVYNWTKADRVYDAILAIGMKPFVEFGFMPADLASGSQTVFHYKGNVTPPKDYKEWGELVYNCVKHWRDKYGLEEIRKWRFEIWNEPNLPAFWSGTQEEYFKLYDYAAMAIKKVDKELKVGGPATAGMGEWVEEFIEHCKTKNYATGGNSVPVDFVSTHGYPWDQGKYYVRDKDMSYPGGQYFYLGIREVQNKIKFSGIPTLKELHITEWGVFDYDTVHAASYVCHILKDVAGFTDTFSFWAVSDVFEENAPVPAREFPGIYGLITVHGLRKASFNVFKMLKMMGDRSLEVNLTRPDVREIESWASRKSPDSSVQVMVWNWRQPDEKNSDRVVKLNLRNLPFKQARMKHYRIDSYSSNVHGFWESIGKPEYPNEMQMQQMKNKSDLILTESKNVDILNGEFLKNLNMPVSSVSLIILEKI